MFFWDQHKTITSCYELIAKNVCENYQLMYVWKYTFPELTAPVAVEAIIWISAIIRIVVCILPQNNWCTDEENMYFTKSDPRHI